ncbi:MAG: sulfite exporter TauE/SafE family protein [Bradymonadia bacterium]
MSIIAVLSASLLGSLHCVGMCGGFVALYSAPGTGGWRAQSAYHLGRLISYATLGALAGFAGSHLDLAGETLLGVQQVAAVAMGGLLIFMGIKALGLFPAAQRAAQHDTPLVHIEDRKRPGLLARMRHRVSTLYRSKGPGPAFAVGLLSTVLPCGWLWGFVAVAAATGSAWMGAVWMAAFWVGTVPALGSLGVATRLMGSALRPYAPRLTAAVMIGFGVLALAGKMPRPAMAQHHHHAPAATTHGEHTTPHNKAAQPELPTPGEHHCH